MRSGKKVKGDLLFPLALLIFSLASALFYLGGTFITNGVLTGTLDDSYIHLVFIRSLVSGLGYSFGGGDWVAGSTSPLWVFLLAGPALIGVDLEILMLFSGWIFYTLSALTLYFFLVYKSLTRLEAFMTALFLILNGPFCWSSFSGMETPLFAFFLTLFPFFAYQIEKNPLGIWGSLSSVWMGLLLWIRPEGGLFAGIFWVFHHFVPLLKKKYSLGPFLRAQIAWVLLFLLYFGFHFYLGGRPFPGTYYAKIAGHKIFQLTSASGYFLDVCWMIFEWNPLMFVSLLISPFLFYRSYLSSSLTAFWSLPIAQSFYFPWNDQGGRYLIPLLPLGTLIVGLFLHEIVFKGWGRKWVKGKKKRLIGMWSLLLFYLMYWFINWGGSYRFSGKNILDMHFKSAEYVMEKYPEEKVIAAGDIGVMGYKTKKQILDINGLITPRIIELQKNFPYEKAITEFIWESQPRVVVALWSWFPFFYRNQNFIPVCSIEVPDEEDMILGGSQMVIYEVFYSSPREEWFSKVHSRPLPSLQKN